MIQSMTGYGRAVCSACQRKVILELKSLNSKQLDLNMRFPTSLRSLEADSRAMISKILKRGKVDLFVYYEDSSQEGSFTINNELALSYFKQINQLTTALGVEKPTDPMEILLKMPEVISSEKEDLSEEDLEKLLKALGEAVENVRVYRMDEGKTTQDDLVQRLDAIEQLMKSIPALAAPRKEKIKSRLMEEMNALEPSLGFDKNRFEQELIYYIEKLDINEELVRLGHHIGFFREVLQESASQGKKLAFITQEIGREINTIGAKANDADIQKIVVLMKDELEKIKEQLHNIL